MADSVFQLKWYCSTGVCPRGAQVRQRCGRWLSPLSSMKTIVRPSFLAFFLTLASAGASTAESWFRSVPVPAPWAADNSIPTAAGCAKRGRDGTRRRRLVGSSAPPAPRSTNRSRILASPDPASAPARSFLTALDSAVACVQHGPPSSDRHVLFRVARSPTDSPIAGAPLPSALLPTDGSLSPAAALPAFAAALAPRSLCVLPPDFPCPHSSIESQKMSVYYVMLNRSRCLRAHHRF